MSLWMKGLTTLAPSYDGVSCISPEAQPCQELGTDPFASSRSGSTATSALGRGLWPPAPSPNQWANPLLRAFFPVGTSCPSVVNK